MAYLLIRHRIRDFATWKAAFDEHGKIRERSGSTGGAVYCTTDDPSEIVILLGWKNLEAARSFAESEDLREAMRRAGVTSKPEFTYLEEIARPIV